MTRQASSEAADDVPNTDDTTRQNEKDLGNTLDTAVREEVKEASSSDDLSDEEASFSEKEEKAEDRNGPASYPEQDEKEEQQILEDQKSNDANSHTTASEINSHKATAMDFDEVEVLDLDAEAKEEEIHESDSVAADASQDLTDEDYTLKKDGSPSKDEIVKPTIDRIEEDVVELLGESDEEGGDHNADESEILTDTSEITPQHHREDFRTATPEFDTLEPSREDGAEVNRTMTDHTTLAPETGTISGESSISSTAINCTYAHCGIWGFARKNRSGYADLRVLKLLFQDLDQNESEAAGYLSYLASNTSGITSSTTIEMENATTETNTVENDVADPTASVNSDFVEGLDDIDKLFEDVDPPDELDVGATGASMQEVIMGQGSRILLKRISMAARAVGTAVMTTKEKLVNVKNVIVEAFHDGEGDHFPPSLSKEDILNFFQNIWESTQLATQNVQVAINEAFDEDGVARLLWRHVVEILQKAQTSIDDLLEGDGKEAEEELRQMASRLDAARGT